jgi:RES domain-containing protein
MYLWRISKFQSLDGGGGMFYSARWHTVGHPVVYLAESAAGAMLEVLAHLELDDEDLPPDYTLLQVEAPDDLAAVTLADTSGSVYRNNLRTSQSLGNQWLENGTSAIARVPSAIMPHTWNYLLNPLHPDAQRLRIASAITDTYDRRLLRLPSDPLT